jgi:hypothetical protein
VMWLATDELPQESGGRCLHAGGCFQRTAWPIGPLGKDESPALAIQNRVAAVRQVRACPHPHPLHASVSAGPCDAAVAIDEYDDLLADAERVEKAQHFELEKPCGPLAPQYVAEGAIAGYVRGDEFGGITQLVSVDVPRIQSTWEQALHGWRVCRGWCRREPRFAWRRLCWWRWLSLGRILFLVTRAAHQSTRGERDGDPPHALSVRVRAGAFLGSALARDPRTHFSLSTPRERNDFGGQAGISPVKNDLPGVWT